MTRVRPSKPFDFSFRDEMLRDPENAAIYLEACLEDNDPEQYREALSHVIKAREGRAIDRGNVTK